MVKALRLGTCFKTVIRKSASSNLVQIICSFFTKTASTCWVSNSDGIDIAVASARGN